MSTPDIIILICFLPAIISGIMKGFIEQAIALVSLILGAWLAFKFSTVVSGWLQPYFEVSETVLNVISFAVIMVAVVLVLFVLSKILTGVTKLVMLGWLDRLLGLVFALLKAGLLIGIAIILFDTLNVKFEFVEEKVLDESVLYAPIRDIAYVIFPYLKELLLKQ
ncbi:MAG: CvpA family protein [Bacteroidales bacterium]|jgi:membrane protein required for colicin V production|nr:CvpA family protein [Bacteroidales bacterium]MBQ4191767.1 CvpA family protein [Bacteroidales bacterium]MBR4568314.1 CvpA family protein [Bacteroidales bacterium]